MGFDQSGTSWVNVVSRVDYKAAGELNAPSTGNLLKVEDQSGNNTYIFGAGQFCVELFGYQFSSVATAQSIISRGGTTPNYVWFAEFDQSSGELRWYYSTNGTTLSNIGESWSPSAATKYDLCFERDSSNDFRMYVDGSILGTATAHAVTYYTGTQHVIVGRRSGGDTTNQNSSYSCDAIRITDVARYGASSYTVPTLPLANQ